MHAEPMIRDTVATTEQPEPTEDQAPAPDRLDENLHHGRAWHRYRYVYRRAGGAGLRILDAASDSGRAALEAARLNPSATVLGIETSPEALVQARERAENARQSDVIEFRAHDPAEPAPESWGPFDLIVCRGGLVRAEDPARVLASLAKSLAHDGLIYLTLPSRSGQAAACALRQAVDILFPLPGGVADPTAKERVRAGCDLVDSLQADHPIRAGIAESARADDIEQFVAESLTARRDWTLDEAVDLLARAGLRFLYAATPWRWRPDRVFAANAHDDLLRDRLDSLPPDALSRLIDALDPTLLDRDYKLYACHRGFEPLIPDWPAARQFDPRVFDRLIPHSTGLMAPSFPPSAGAGGRSIYRTVSGTLGELDRWSRLALDLTDGTASCGAIEQALAARTRAGDPAEFRQQRWIDLADSGLILLESRSEC